jgi:hypothetical protein
VKIPGPISLPSWSVFDQRKALSFNCQVIYFLLFYISKQSKSILLICYGYVLNLGALACRLCHRKLVHASQINITHLIHRLLLKMNRSKRLIHAFVDTGIFGQHDPG